MKGRESRMKDTKGSYMYEIIRGAIDAFDECMNDYLFIYAVREDIYHISPKATKRFSIEKSEFTDALEEHAKFVYPDDLQMLMNDLAQLVAGIKTEHNLVYRWLDKNRKPIWINCRARIILGEDEKPQFLVGCINEIGTKPLADNVSGLLESIAIKDKLNEFHKLTPNGFVLRVGIDDFKSINEKFGIEYGDYVLRGVAECIVDSVSEGQNVYRVVADEFMVMDMNGATEEEAQKLYRKIRNRVDKFIKMDNYKAVYTISGGIVLGNSIDKMEYNEVMKISQFALTTAKNRGKNQTYCFDASDYKAFIRERELLEQLRKSVSDGFRGFELFFQPIVLVGQKVPFMAESLLRFKTTEGENISPVEFIPILEESGLIIPVGKWIIDRALSMCAECQKTNPNFKISVNLSYVQILKSDVCEEIEHWIGFYNLKPVSLMVELTESGYVDDNSSAVKRMWDRLRKHGVMIALDDFGTGYSNFQLISSMVPNVVKLDRSFTVKALQNAFEHQLMDHIIQLVHSVNLKICVEGVETQTELEEIEKLSADCIQGYFYGRPCCRRDFLKKFIQKAE